jgi:hypothetical protein
VWKQKVDEQADFVRPKVRSKKAPTWSVYQNPSKRPETLYLLFLSVRSTNRVAFLRKSLIRSYLTGREKSLSCKMGNQNV